MALSSLPLFHRVEGKHVVVVGDDAMAEAKTRLVERAGGKVCSEAEAHLASLAFVALEDESAAEKACARLKQRGLLVNVADRPELCDFTLPSVLERDPVLVAIGTGGASAGLAKHLRLRLERILPESLGKLARALSKAKDHLRERFPDAAERRRAIDTALAEGGALDPLDPVRHDDVETWLAGKEAAQGPTVQIIALTSDDPEELTLREARWLGEADVLLLDGEISEAILVRARADAERKPYDEVATVEPTSGLTVILRRIGSD